MSTIQDPDVFMPVTNTEAENIIEDWAQDYAEKFGLESELHDNCQRTSAEVLFNKAIENADKSVIAYVMSLLVDANKYRTMDIMGICRYLINNDVKFKETYKVK